MLDVIVAAGVGAGLALVLGRGSTASVVFAALAVAVAVVIAFSPGAMLSLAFVVASTPRLAEISPGGEMRVLMLLLGGLIGGAALFMTAIVNLVTPSPPKAPRDGPSGTGQGGLTAAQRARRRAGGGMVDIPATPRAEPPVTAPSVTLDDARKAEIEAEERYRAEVRARLARENGNGPVV